LVEWSHPEFGASHWTPELETVSETAAGRAGTRDAMVFLIFIMHYHKLMSNDIPNDDYFVLLLRKAWQIRALRTSPQP
jgi:hypothetical protein